MINNIEFIELIKSKVQTLIHKNKKLKDKNHQLTKKTVELRDEIKNLNRKLEVLSLVNELSVGDENATKKAHLKIKKILREIDSCIALINNN